jgi:hypothetical protein
MDIEAYEKALQTAQKISFAYEDLFGDKSKRKIFGAIFDRFLLPVDPAGSMEPYDAIIALWRHSPDEYDQMVRELEKFSLI